MYVGIDVHRSESQVAVVDDEAARAATARRLLESLYHVLRDDEPYDPPAFVFG